MFNEKLFKQQLKEWKEKNSEENTRVKYDVLNTIDLFNKDNIYNINMILNSENEAVDFVNRVENPDEDWKTITDIIIDVRKEKLEQTTANTDYIGQLIENSGYIELHKELERIFLHKILFSMIKKFVQKVEKLGVQQATEIINQHKERGFSTAICYM